MAYTISKVTYHTVKDGNKYFLDSNIWIEILTSRNSEQPKHKKYRELFQKIISNPKARIVLPALMVSEVINRILREVYMSKYARKNGFTKGQTIPANYYKDVFRASQDFKIAYNSLCDDIKAYHASIDLIPDTFGTVIKYKHVMSDPPQGLDFNDYYYYLLAKKNSYIIVTDDKDFWVEDIEIVTESTTLMEKQYSWTASQSKIQESIEEKE